MSRPLYPKTWNTEYVCSGCGHRAPVEFFDPAAYAEDEPITGRDHWAIDAALAAAQARLEKSGRRALRLVRCPACHKRDRLASRRVYLWAALPLLGASPAIFLVAMIIAAQAGAAPQHGARAGDVGGPGDGDLVGSGGFARPPPPLN